MARFRVVIVALMILGYLLTGGERTTRVLCIESDGTVTIEDSSELCCGTQEARASECCDEDGVRSSTDDCPCVDIPLPPGHVNAPHPERDAPVASLAPALVLVATPEEPFGAKTLPLSRAEPTAIPILRANLTGTAFRS